jgi:hypothetical protein
VAVTAPRFCTYCGSPWAECSSAYADDGRGPYCHGCGQSGRHARGCRADPLRTLSSPPEPLDVEVDVVVDEGA